MVLSFVSASSLAGAPGVILSFAGASSLGALGVLFRFVGFNFLAAPGRALPRQVELCWWAKVVPYSLPSRVVGWYSAVLPTHPGRVGPQRNLTTAAAGWGLQGGREGPGAR